MFVEDAAIGQTIKDRTDGHTLTIKRKPNKFDIEVVVVKAPKKPEHIDAVGVGGTYIICQGYGGNNWEPVNNSPVVKKPVTKLDSLKNELEQARANVEKIEASIAKVKESLALKPGTMYKHDDHFEAGIFILKDNGRYEFYVGGEIMLLYPDDLEKFQPLTLPNQRKMAKAVVNFFEGRIPNN